MLLAVSLFSACKDDNKFVPESMQQQVSADKSYSVNGYNINMIYVPEVLTQSRVDMNGDLKIVTQASYYIMQNELTQGLFSSVAGYNPSWDEYIGENLPVNYLNLFQCRDFAKMLNDKLGTPGYFRLPSSKEWVYAAQDGNKTGAYTYSGSNDINAVAWYKGNSDGHPHTVGLKEPNKLGIYDLSGNIGEWTDDTRYNSDGSVNGEVTGNIYGGNFDVDANVCVVASTVVSQPASNTHYTYGFRLAATASSGTLIDLSAENLSQPSGFKWNVTPVVNGSLCSFQLEDTQDPTSDYKINLDMISSNVIDKWEFFPENPPYNFSYYILEINKDIVGNVYDGDNKAYDVVSGFVGIKNGNVVMSLTIKSADGQMKTIKGSREIIVNMFDLADLGEIYPELDPNDSKTCLFYGYVGGQLHSTTKVSLTSSSVTSWNLYKKPATDAGTALRIGKDVTVETTMADGTVANFTVGAMTLYGSGKIALNATGIYEDDVCSITTKTSKTVSTRTYDVTGKQVIASAAMGKTCDFTIDGDNVLTLVLNDNYSWIFEPTSGNNYENYSWDVQLKSGTILSSGVMGDIQSGSLTLGQGLFIPNLIGWMDNVLTTITGSQALTTTN